MRWCFKPSKNKTKWHLWFAWHPVRVNNCIIWLETVDRMRVILPFNNDFGPYLSPDVWWEYRDIG